MEKLIYSDNCFICNELMGHFKSELTVVTSYSEKPIFQLIGKKFHGNLKFTQ